MEETFARVMSDFSHLQPEMISSDPPVVLFHSFLSNDEAEAFILHGKGRYAKSLGVGLTQVPSTSAPRLHPAYTPLTPRLRPVYAPLAPRFRPACAPLAPRLRPTCATFAPRLRHVCATFALRLRHACCRTARWEMWRLKSVRCSICEMQPR